MDSLIKTILDGNFSALKEYCDCEIATKIAGRINEKKIDVLAKINGKTVAEMTRILEDDEPVTDDVSSKVMALSKQGKSTQQIAQTLGMEESEVEQIVNDEKAAPTPQPTTTSSSSSLPISEAKKEDPKAAVRNRGDAVFAAGHKNVKDDKDHFPINSESQARNALARVHQYKKAPSWYNGTLASLKKTVVAAVHKKYPSIKLDVKKDIK